MQFIVFFLLFGTITSDLLFEWNKFKRDHNKQYKTVAEENQRQQIFIENVNRMRSYQQTHPDATFTMTINHLMDRQLVETLHAIETGNLIKGSISQVYDCCPQPIDAFECIQNMSGICRDSDYPTALGSCQPNKCRPFTTFDKVNRLEKPDEDIMLAWIQESTLWAEINLAGEGFTTYTTGIYDEPLCSEAPIDYVVQIVGYGVEEGKPYWICKNSWGENWGDKGYFRIVRGKNMCRIAEVVVQVANTKKNDGAQQYTIASIPLAFILALISRIFS